MRKFYLHTFDKSITFDLNTEKALAAEPQGLGNGFATSYKESNDGNHLTNVKPSFDPITLKIYFNADGSDGYGNYKSLLTFLSACGKSDFLFEYDDGITDKFCDVILKSITKTEISSEGLFCETLTLERQTYWFEIIEDSFIFGKSELDPVFPMSFPFGFSGALFNSEHKARNDFFSPAPLNITISGNIFYGLNIYIKSLAGEIISQIDFQSEPAAGAVVTINATKKKITVTQNGVSTNGYDLTDKTKQSFLYLPQGEYYIGANISASTTGKIEVSIRRYLYD
ncbi:MAG TPA: hypothetical protein DEV87_06510 [Clostridiales bacterium]|jgi:hypothetical protein|nr:MAG TPA: Baseplate protein [Caudoviricetes sp.]HCH74813.1 hypothetical protein [Clostridiales bacterium]